MKSVAFSCLLLLVVAPLSADDEVTRALSSDPVVVAGEAVRVELKVGELRIVGTDQDRLEAHLTATCRKGKPKCVRKLETLRVAVIESASGLEVVFEGINKRRARRMDFEAVVLVPRTSPVNVKMGVGELEVEDLRRDLAVDMWIGDLSIRMAQADVHSVLLDTGIGDAAIHASGSDGVHHRPLLVGKEVRWMEGAGSARLDVDLQIGDISVELQ